MIRASILFAIVFFGGTTMVISIGHAQTPTIVLAERFRSSSVQDSIESSGKRDQVQSDNYSNEEVSCSRNTGVVKLMLKDDAQTFEQPLISSSAPSSHSERTEFRPIATATPLNVPAVAASIPIQTVAASESMEAYASAEEPESIRLPEQNVQSSPGDFSPPLISIRPKPTRPIQAGVDSSYQVRMEPLPGESNQFRMVVEIPESVREMEIAPRYSEGNRRVRVTIDHESGIAGVGKNDSSQGSMQERERHTGCNLSQIRPEIHGAEARTENHAFVRADSRFETTGHRQFQKNPYYDLSSLQSSSDLLARDRMLKPIANPYATTEYRAIEEVASGNMPVGSALHGEPIQASAIGPARTPVQIHLSDESVSGSGAIYR